MMQTVTILGTPISRLGFGEALDWTSRRGAQSQGGYICFANVHTVTEATRSPRLSSALRGSDLAAADGMPLVWVSKLRLQPIGSRVCGPDFMDALIRMTPQGRHAFIGGSASQGSQLIQKYGLAHAVAHSPPFREFSEANAQADWQEILKLAPEPPQFAWVGLGAPKQELWMQAVSRIPSASKTVFLGVGAAFDFLTGSKSRAPKWMQGLGLEWLYRLCSEPRRLASRYFSTNPRFVLLSILETLGVWRGPRQ